ncbi:PNOC protein, partial [Struthidea cinerea]|nr:PNOC protein [Struthidea cinerea]
MRAMLWDLLLLLCLFARARGDCRGDCLHCDRQLYRDSFDVLVKTSRRCWSHPSATKFWGATSTDVPVWPRNVGLEAPAPSSCLVLLLELQPEARRGAGMVGGPWIPWQVRSQSKSGLNRQRRDLGSSEAQLGLEEASRGGFIGVRKSARKWNNQKRFSEFLKQYLGMAPRSSEYGLGGGTGERNEI